MTAEKSDRLDDPVGGPSVASKSDASESSDEVDLSAGAEGQDAGEGAVQEAREQTERDKPTPG